MWLTFRLLIFLLALSAGCSDFKLHSIEKNATGADDVPNILVTPSEIDFGALNAGHDLSTETVTIENVGSDTLHINEIALNDISDVFSISILSADSDLEPSETSTLTVTYSPQTYETNSNSIVITSNDPDDYEERVDLKGSGEAPVISIEPTEYDFGNVLVGCVESEEIIVSNIGNVDLIIDRVDYYITYPADLGITNFEDEYGPLPWVLIPGASIVLEIFYYPTDVDVDYGTIEVFSNDPQTSVAIADQSAVGVYSATYEEIFEQNKIDAIDILFVIDNSCSMNANQAQLATNFSIFMNVFDLSSIDYQMGFITTDDYSMQGSLITPATVDPIGDVAIIISNIGTLGSTLEQGVGMAYQALQTGNDFGPGGAFWRTDSKLIIIFVSDEEDHSTVSVADFKAYVVAVKGSADYITANAVAGDYPGGCAGNGGGQASYIYYTLVNEFAGTFLSICQDDWGTPLEALAQASILKSTFTLSKDAVEETIYVEVNGIEASEWIFDSLTNTISFNDGFVPGLGALIHVSYNPISICPP